MARPFHEVLAEIDSGLLMEQVSEKLATLVRGVLDVEKSGTITLQITVKPNGDGKVIVDGKVTNKVPEKPVDQSFFFARPNGDLTRNSPKQDEAVSSGGLRIAN